MSKPQKKALVPALRFPEFREAGKWENTLLGKLGDFTGGGTPTKSNNSYWRGSIPWVSSSDIHEESIHEFSISRYITEEAINDSATKLIPENSILLVSRVGVGKLAISKNSICTSQDFTNFTPVRDDLIFLGYYLKSRTKSLLGYSQGMAIKGFTKDDISNLAVSIPSVTEQQKIADCLSSLDDLITAQTQKLTALKAHKKGLMQQLFPAEGETVPKLRFPEFRDGGEWEEKTLEQVARYENGKAHEQDIDEEGEYIVVNSKFISTEGEVKKFSHSANLLAEKDDILMVLSDIPNGKAIAKCFYVDKDDTYTVNQRICKLTAKDTVSTMLFYILDRNAYFLDFDDGVKQTNLKKDDVLNCPILLPKDKTEQQKIVDCLSSVDELITAQSLKIEALKSHKKGLMQQLFPSMDKVDG